LYPIDDPHKLTPVKYRRQAHNNTE
jgi:hypothetical protein